MATDLTRLARRRTRRLLLAAAAGVIVLVVVIAAAVLAASRLDGRPPAKPVSPSLAATVPSPPGGAQGGVLTWVSVAGARLPVSAGDGPHTVRAGRAWGFAHDQTGAALAAFHVTLRLTPQAGPDIYGPTLAQQVVAGADADALRTVVDEEYSQLLTQYPGVAYGHPMSQVAAAAAGYRIDSYDGTTTSVRMLMRTPSATDTGADGTTSDTGGSGAAVWTACVVQMRWTGKDWALLAPPGGDWSAMVTRVASRSGYQPLPGGS